MSDSRSQGEGRRKARVFGALSFGLAGCTAGLGFGYWVSTLPAVSDVSLCWAFRPWPWRPSNLILGVVGGLIGAGGGAWLVRLSERTGAMLADRVE